MLLMSQRVFSLCIYSSSSTMQVVWLLSICGTDFDTMWFVFVELTTVA